MAVYYHEGKFPPESLDWQRIIGPLADATEAIARYDSFLGIIPDADILIAPLMTQEAVTSSRIEGATYRAHLVCILRQSGYRFVQGGDLPNYQGYQGLKRQPEDC